VWRVINQLCVPGVAVFIRRVALVGYVYVSPFPLRFGARCLHNLSGYELTSNTTYEQFVHDVESEETDIGNLLPPEFPEMRIWFRFSHPTFDRRFHRDCPGAGGWDSETCRTFSDVYEAIESRKRGDVLVSLLP